MGAFKHVQQVVHDLLSIAARAPWRIQPSVLCNPAVRSIQQVSPGGSNPASLRCLFDRVFKVEGQESVGGWIAG